MITAGQLRASRALLGIDQRKLAEAAGLSLPTIQRMEASDGVIRGNVDSLMKLVAALDALGIELIADNAVEPRRRPRRAAEEAGARDADDRTRAAPRLLLALAALAVRHRALAAAHARRLWRAASSSRRFRSSAALAHLLGAAAPSRHHAAARHCRGSARISASTRCRPSSSSSSISAPSRASLFALGYGEHETGAAARAAVLSRLSRRHEPRRARRRRLHLPVLLGVHVAHVVGAGDGAPPRAPTMCAPATSIWSWRASARSRCCSPSACWPGPDGALHLRADARRASLRGARRAGADPGADRRRLEGRPRAAACLAAARPSGGAEPRLGADERRHDQGRRLRLRAHRLRSRSARRPGGGAWSCWRSAASPR